MTTGSGLIFYDEVSSTNTAAASLLKSGNPAEGTVIYSDFQSAGKGQTGNRWISEKGKNLLLSIILYPEKINPEEQFLLTVIVSLALSDLLNEFDIRNSIKWPNDIFAGEMKIAGILIENTIIGDTIASTVIGTGINVNQTEWPEFLPSATSMKKITGKEYDRNQVMKKLFSCLDARYKRLLYGNRNGLQKEYVSRLYRYGEWQKYRHDGRIFSGQITGVSHSGNIRIRKRSGSVDEFAFKEVEYII